MDAVPLELPADLRWSCLGSGRCCREFDAIEIDPATAERLRRLPLFHPRLLASSARSDELPYVLSDGRILLARVATETGGARCVFLDQDRRCAVHAAHGVEAKPSACRVFPFVFAETPEGTRAGVSFACTAVLHDSGEPILGQARELQALAEGAPRRRLETEPPDGDYPAMERELIAILDAAPGVESALLRQAEWLAGSALGAPSPRLRRAALSWLGSLQPIPPPPAPSDLAPIPLPAPEPELLLRRWLRHRLFRRDLLRLAPLRVAHALLAAETALAIDLAERTGMVEAVRTVEVRLVLHDDVARRLDRIGRRWLLAPRLVPSLCRRLPP